MTDEPQIQRSAASNHLLEDYLKPRTPVGVLFILWMLRQPVAILSVNSAPPLGFCNMVKNQALLKAMAKLYRNFMPNVKPCSSRVWCSNYPDPCYKIFSSIHLIFTGTFFSPTKFETLYFSAGLIFGFLTVHTLKGHSRWQFSLLAISLFLKRCCYFLRWLQREPDTTNLDVLPSENWN